MDGMGRLQRGSVRIICRGEIVLFIVTVSFLLRPLLCGLFLSGFNYHMGWIGSLPVNKVMWLHSDPLLPSGLNNQME